MLSTATPTPQWCTCSAVRWFPRASSRQCAGAGFVWSVHGLWSWFRPSGPFSGWVSAHVVANEVLGHQKWCRRTTSPATLCKPQGGLCRMERWEATVTQLDVRRGRGACSSEHSPPDSGNPDASLSWHASGLISTTACACGVGHATMAAALMAQSSLALRRHSGLMLLLPPALGGTFWGSMTSFMARIPLAFMRYCSRSLF